MRPKRIILVRHEESEGNRDHEMHARKPDHALELTDVMLRMTTDSGDVFFGRDAEELMMRMRDTVWEPRPSPEEYMRQVARRVNGMTGRELRLEPEGFIADLEAAGLVEVAEAD